ncbi:MAG: ABC transporter permease [Proteobacteria bacterium]|jgi:branched-chain amino acid transport system permease protein|nr:ABC transporter permease [Candidatus Fonsibacter lacus]
MFKKNIFSITVFFILLVIPLLFDSFYVNNISFFILWTFISLGLALIWGMGGILSFGQTAFFGLAGYSFAIISINFADTFAVGVWAPIIALFITAIFGAIVGYFLFYGGIYDVFIGIVTLAITLVLETFMAQTAGPEWTIGNARLNGFNGMQGMPTIGFKINENKFLLQGLSQYYFMVFLSIFLLWILYKIKKSNFGLILLASKEDRIRAESLGHNVKKIQMIAFSLSALFAGVSGILYTNWGGYITPSSMGLVAAAMPVIWVAASGKNDFFSVFLGCILLVYTSQTLAVNGAQYAIILMGFILVIVTRYFPEGIILMIKKKITNKFF